MVAKLAIETVCHPEWLFLFFTRDFAGTAAGEHLPTLKNAAEILNGVAHAHHDHLINIFFQRFRPALDDISLMGKVVGRLAEAALVINLSLGINPKKSPDLRYYLSNTFSD